VVSRFWSLVFLDGGNYPSSPDEEAWIKLLVSETALAQVSMAIGIRYWSPNVSYQKKSVAHSSKAANIIIQRIKFETAHTGAVIGAVLSMAIGERLMHNDLIWNIHVDGLANIITERRSQGEYNLPPVLCDFLILCVYPLLPRGKANRIQLPFGISQENHCRNTCLWQPAYL
jgi:hypothetical protein